MWDRSRWVPEAHGPASLTKLMKSRSSVFLSIRWGVKQEDNWRWCLPSAYVHSHQNTSLISLLSNLCNLILIKCILKSESLCKLKSKWWFSNIVQWQLYHWILFSMSETLGSIHIPAKKKTNKTSLWKCLYSNLTYTSQHVMIKFIHWFFTSIIEIKRSALDVSIVIL